MTSNCIVVLGMHRSGTSVTTALLHSMGAYVGREDQLTGRSVENPTGFFERRDLRNYCDTLLTAAGADWWRVAHFDSELIPDRVMEEQTAVLQGILGELDSHATWAIKEPRLCILLPIVRRVVDDVVIVHVVRDPVEVATSLRQRNRFPMQAGLALWEAYRVAALRHSAGLRQVTVNYNELVRSPADTVARLREQLAGIGVIMPADGDPGIVAAELHREHASAHGAERLLSAAQRELAASDGSDVAATVSEEALRILREFEEDQAELQSLKQRVRQSEADARAAKRAVAREVETEALTQKLDAIEHSIRALASGTVASRDAEIEGLTRALAEATQRSEQLAEQNDELQSKVETASGQIAKSHDELAHMGDVAKASALVQVREAQWLRLMGKRDAQIERLASRIERLNAEFDRLYRIAKNAEEVGTLARLRRRASAMASRLRGKRAESGGYGDLLDAAMATRRAVRAKKGAYIPPDTASDVARFPPTIGLSKRGFGRVAFVTAIAGNYDPVIEPSIVDLSADYFLFTDDPSTKSAVWQTRPFDFVHADPARTARFVKTHPHLYFAGYDRVIWVDANLRINCLVEDLIPPGQENADLVTWQHPLRDCVYQEASECLLRQKDDEASIVQHVQRLRQAGYPENNGLIESSVIVAFLRSPRLVPFMNEWWRLIDNGSRRDQMSFNPALAANPNVKVGFLGEKGVEMRTDPRFTYHHHPSYRPLALSAREVAA